MEQLALDREYRHYKAPAVISSPFIRTLYDSIGPFKEKRHGLAEMPGV